MIVAIVFAVLYIVGGVLTYGLGLGEWYQWYEERGYEGMDLEPTYRHVVLFAFMPCGLMTQLWILHENKNRKYLFKWSLKGLKQPDL